MDVLLVSGLDFTKADAALPQLGQEILQNILSDEFSAKLINFDMLNASGQLPYADKIEETLDSMAAYLTSFEAKIIGFYTICNSFLTVVQLAQRVRRSDPRVKIIFGGPHATLTAEHCLNAFSFLDVVCLGESENSILPLIRAMIHGNDLSDVPGIAYRQGSAIVRTPCCPLIEDDELGKYTVFDHGPDYSLAPERMALEGGRGCPYGCTFCSTSMFWGRRFRIKSVQTLVAEMDRFHELYGTTDFSIQHDIFTANRAHIQEFCRILIDRGRPYRWRCSSRVDVLDEELVGNMAKAGCDQMYLGIETGSSRMQRIIKKNLKLDDAERCIGWLTRAGIYTTSSFIYGFPEEREEDFQETLSIMEKLYLSGNRSIQLHRFFPLPSTEEAMKVYDEAYFDENDVDLSIFNRRVINDEGRELILGHKDLFLQFYTFPSRLRSAYPWIDTVSLLFSMLSDICYETCCCLLRHISMRELYLKYEPIFRDISLRFSNLIYDSTLSEVLLGRLKEILSREELPEAQEMLRYECDVMTYVQSGKSEPEIYEYAWDISGAINRGEYVKKPTSIMLWREAGSGKPRAVPVPKQIKISDSDKNT